MTNFKRIMSFSGSGDAILHGDECLCFDKLDIAVNERVSLLEKEGISKGLSIALVGSASIDWVVSLLALIRMRSIVVPIVDSDNDDYNKKIEIANPHKILIHSYRELSVCEHDTNSVGPGFPQFLELNKRDHPGLILFSSGTSGLPKAIVLDLFHLINEIKISEKKNRLLVLLLVDHIGGINTVLNALVNRNALVISPSATPRDVIKAINKSSVTLLPTSPSFLKLLLASGELDLEGLPSLKIITYGTEPMPLNLLARLVKKLPGVKFIQTYGLSETGIVETKSFNSRSIALRFVDYEKIRVQNNKIEIKKTSTMLGYLNHPFIVSEDGWFETGDVVEETDEGYLIKGRDSEIVIIGGLKVYPSEVEDVLLQHPSVIDVTVSAEENQLLGNVLVASIVPKDKKLTAEILKKELIYFLVEKIEKYKIPIKYVIAEKLHSDRLKKIR